MKVEKDTRKERLDIIATQFCNITITESDKTELSSMLDELLKDYNSETIHFGIERSGAENFFHDAKEALKKCLREDVFSDSKIYLTIAHEIAKLFLSKERVRNFSFIENAGFGKTVWHPSSHHISCCEKRVGDMMLSLGFLEDALNFYIQARGTGDNSGATESMYKLAAIYKKSGQKIDKIDEMISKLASHVMNNTRRETAERLRKWPYSAEYWDKPLKEATKLLSELGYEENEQHQKLQPTYRAIIEELIENRDKSIELKNKGLREPHKPEEIGCRANHLADMYRLIGDEKNALNWETIYSNAKCW